MICFPSFYFCVRRSQGSDVPTRVLVFFQNESTSATRLGPLYIFVRVTFFGRGLLSSGVRKFRAVSTVLGTISPPAH